MLKKLFLKYKTRANVKKRSLQQSKDFEESSKIVIFYSDLFENVAGIEKTVTELKAEGKEVSLLVFCHDVKKVSTSMPHLTLKDVSLVGKIHKDEVSFILNQHYDFAICLDTSSHYAVDYIFSLINARCRVGNLHPNRKNLFEMMVSADKKETDLCCEILKYVKMIKTYEY